MRRDSNDKTVGTSKTPHLFSRYHGSKQPCISLRSSKSHALKTSATARMQMLIFLLRSCIACFNIDRTFAQLLDRELVNIFLIVVQKVVASATKQLVASARSRNHNHNIGYTIFSSFKPLSISSGCCWHLSAA
jgi:hypothetical protein